MVAAQDKYVIWSAIKTLFDNSANVLSTGNGKNLPSTFGQISGIENLLPIAYIRLNSSEWHTEGIFNKKEVSTTRKSYITFNPSVYHTSLQSMDYGYMVTVNSGYTNNESKYDKTEIVHSASGIPIYKICKWGEYTVTQTTISSPGKGGGSSPQSVPHYYLATRYKNTAGTYTTVWISITDVNTFITMKDNTATKGYNTNLSTFLMCNKSKVPIEEEKLAPSEPTTQGGSAGDNALPTEPPKEPDPTTQEPSPYANWSGTNDYEIQGGYKDELYSQDSKEAMDFWAELYGGYNGYYSLKSHQSIIGLPLQFMGNVDMRIGSSTYGKQYMEDILYDMNIAIIKPGGPVLNPMWDGDAKYTDSFEIGTNIASGIGKFKAYWESIQNDGFAGFMKQYIFMMMKGGRSRFYSFQSDYTHYTHYVNTICHMFITFLGIGSQTYRTGSGIVKTYAEYKDDIQEIESDGGDGLKKQFGSNNAVYMYYSDEGSALNQSFTNTTGQSGLASTLQTASDASKEWGFFLNAAGIEKGKGLAKFGTALQDTIGSNSNTFLGRLFGKAVEGVTTILAGNNLSLPEIYMDSDTAVEHTFKIRLVSPYGDPESVFLYVLRPLARLLAFSLPRQYGPNSYQSPFIVQAFSKGQFNCQLGIVTNLSITRCGQGGESHTINHIPTELDVTITIQDMYEKVFLSNEYFGNSAGKALIGGLIDIASGKESGAGIGSAILQAADTHKATQLLFNNVGLIDFMASFCGFNLNMPTFMSGWTLIWNMMKNRTQEYVTYSQNDGWAFPQWEKALNDAFNDASTNLSTFIVATN